MIKQALLVIDVQQGLFATPRYDGEALIARLNEIADRFRKKGAPVIFIQHCGPEGEELHPAQPGHALDPRLTTAPADIRIAKQSCDAFLDTPLSDTLASLSIAEVVITGFATEFCVDTTVRSALARGLRVVVPADGHTTADRPHLSASKVIEHHNATWPWLISPAGAARMTICADVG